MKRRLSSKRKPMQPIFVKNIFKLCLSALSRSQDFFNYEFLPLSYINTAISSFLFKINIKQFLANLNIKIKKKFFYFSMFLLLLFYIIFFSCPDIAFRKFFRRSRFHFVASTIKKILLLYLMFKFNPAEYKKLDSKSDQFNSISKGIIDNATLN